MSIASAQILPPTSPRLNRMVGDQANRLHLAPVRRQGSDSNCTSGRDISPKKINGHLKHKPNPLAVGPGPSSKAHAPVPSSPKPIVERAKAAAIVLNRYRIEYKNDWDFPQSILCSQAQIQKFLERDHPIELVIPAFPFKSSNRSKKVLGPLPDEAERLSLLHLNGLCLAIKDATYCDTFLTIVSDGITYNDILGVSDQEVWRYGHELRQMAEKNGCRYIRFARICDLIGAEHEIENLDEELYLSKVSEYRSLLEANAPSSFDVLDAITNDPDISKTYKGYKKFLLSERDDRTNRSRSQTERENSGIAKAMIFRGKAFAETVKSKYPDSVRLSIHPSNDTNKVSITMLPQDNEIVMTPWHGAVVRSLDGSVSMSHAILIPAMTHDIVHVDGRPSYFRERSEIFNCPNKDISFEYMYPCGIIIKPANPTSIYPLSMVDMQKVRTLATTCSPVVLRGFSNTEDCGEFITRACYGLNPARATQEVQDTSNHATQGSIMAPAEVMNSNIFKIAMVEPEHSNNDKKTPDAPHFHRFVSLSVPRSDDDCMLFASSDLFARYLPQAYNISKLEKIKWKCPSCHVVEDTPLVVRHPTRNSPCIRWHQPRLKWRTSYGFDDLRISNGSQGLIPLINSLLVDRRVCLRFREQEGDVLVFENLSMLYTMASSSNSSRSDL